MTRKVATTGKETPDKQTLINREIARITKLLKDVDPQKKNTVKGLVDVAGYMRITLQELQREIDCEGPIDVMPQGEYSIIREHPLLKSYNTMAQRYASIIKQLTDLLPKDKLVEVGDGFDEFITSRTD